MKIRLTSRCAWSPTALALVASMTACTVCAIAATIIMWNYIPFPGDGRTTWRASDIFLVVCFSYSQLVASTIFHSSVSRSGNVIEGMIYSDLGNDYIRTTICQWMLRWFISVLCWSTVISAIGVAILYALAQK